MARPEVLNNEIETIALFLIEARAKLYAHLPFTRLCSFVVFNLELSYAEWFEIKFVLGVWLIV